MSATPTPAHLHRSLRSLAREQWQRIDRPGWRRFLLALLGLALALFFALYATALHDTGRYELAAVVAAISLVLAGIVGVKSVPYLARRTALERWMVKIEYEITREGAVYLFVVLVIAVAALNTGNNLLFLILACLLAGILVSGIASLIVLSGLELELDLPEHLFARQPSAMWLTVRNLKWAFPSLSITVDNQPSKKPGGWARGGQAGTSRQRACRIPMDPIYIPYLKRRTSARAEIEVTFPHRGRYTEDGFRISTRFPFGLLRKARPAPLNREVLVLPSLQPTEEFYEILPLVSGELESLEKGRGHDLYAIRDYRQTDTARHVDWKATAKTQQLKVREFTREDERRVALVFDARVPGSDDQTLASFERAVTFCACLAWHFHEIDAQMQFLSESLETPMAAAGEIIYPALENLAVVEPIVISHSHAVASSVPDLLTRLSAAPDQFNIILTFQPRGCIPTSLWSSSYVVFGDSL